MNPTPVSAHVMGSPTFIQNRRAIARLVALAAMAFVTIRRRAPSPSAVDLLHHRLLLVLS
ncbi:MAG: hypothetical protein KDC48_16240 [Planctomycetes bacterium]|nr:hypothetical protein [Planctomycetota bacterium]